MNQNLPLRLPKYHKLMTVLAEVACLCLIVASIIAGLGDALQKARSSAASRSDPQSSGSVSGSDSVILGGSQWISTDGEYDIVVVNPGSSASGSASQDDVSGSFATGSYEAVTDENGNTYFHFVAGSAGQGSFVTVMPGPDTSITAVSYTSAVGNVLRLLFYFLPCVLLLLYTLHFYQKPKSRRLMAVLTGVYAVGFLVSAISAISYIQPIEPLPLFAYLLLPAALAVLLGVMTALFWKGTIRRRLAFVTFILAWLHTGLCLLGSLSAGDTAILIASLLFYLGAAAFQIALCAYACRKEDAAPTDASDGDSNGLSEESNTADTAV